MRSLLAPTFSYSIFPTAFAEARPFKVQVIVAISILVDDSDLSAGLVKPGFGHHMFIGTAPLDKTADLGDIGDIHVSPLCIQLRLATGWDLWERLPYRDCNTVLQAQHPLLPNHLATWLVPANVITWRKIRHITGKCRPSWNNADTEDILHAWCSAGPFTQDQVTQLRRELTSAKEAIYDSLGVDVIARPISLGHKVCGMRIRTSIAKTDSSPEVSLECPASVDTPQAAPAPPSREQGDPQVDGGLTGVSPHGRTPSPAPSPDSIPDGAHASEAGDMSMGVGPVLPHVSLADGTRLAMPWYATDDMASLRLRLNSTHLTHTCRLTLSIT